MKRTILLLTACIVLLLPIALRAETQDTIWTRRTWPSKIANAVFSNDGNFIYVAGQGNPSRLSKYDINGNLLWINDTVGGIKRFSTDGNYFYNFQGDKYNANTFEIVLTILFQDNIFIINVLYFLVGFVLQENQICLTSFFLIKKYLYNLKHQK